MRYLKSILLALLLTIVILGGIGYFLKSEYKVERSILIQSPADTLFSYLNNLEHWQKWTVWNKEKDASFKFQKLTFEAGKGAKVGWHGEYTEPVTVEITESQPGKMIQFKYTQEDAFPGKGLLRLDSQGKSTKVTWRMEGNTGWNVAERYFLFFMEKFLESDMEEGLKGLKKMSERE